MDDLHFDDAGFDDPTSLIIEGRHLLPVGGRARSTPQTRERYAFLRTKRVGTTWQEGERIFRMGAGGVTVYDPTWWCS